MEGIIAGKDWPGVSDDGTRISLKDGQGIVTDIMRFSLKDGPGIRTTVFLKGCNMACKWCHNPETFSMAPQLMRYPANCIGCGACAAACQSGAMGVESAASFVEIVYDRGKCDSCGACADVCFSGALVISGRKMGVADVMAEVVQDIDYYRNSGGGLTVSGGEVACQPEFTEELLRAAKGAGIHTAIETNMHANWRVFKTMLPWLDLVMLDIKLSGGAAHMEWTGADNALALENTRRIAELKPTIVRTPIVPGVNDSAEEIGRIAEIVRGLKNVVCYELLSYNPLGEGKYTALDMGHEFRGARPPGRDKTDGLMAAARACGAPVKLV